MLSDKRWPVMVGISHRLIQDRDRARPSTRSDGRHSGPAAGAASPVAGPPTRRDLIAYFEAVGRETKLPITLYLNPGPGADVSVPATIALAKLDKVRFIKESSRDLARVSRLIVEIDHAGHAKILHDHADAAGTSQLGGAGATMPPPGVRDRARTSSTPLSPSDYERAAEIQLQFALFPASWMHRGLDADHEGGDAPHRHPGRRTLPALCRRSTRDEMTAMAATLKNTVLAPRFKAAAA